jgi:putative redox protein
MSRQKVEFINAKGQWLAGALELPDNAAPKAYALFAHCFTCGKDVVAATRIARTLAEQGIAVLRFDFTGLGGSDGDFANSSFSGNVSDLEAAAAFLAEQYQAPALLIGHSLGGTAVLVAARRLDSVQAVVTIAAPATPQHVKHLFADQTCDIRQAGRAPVEIAGRTFELGAELLEDLDHWPLADTVGALRKPLLVFHSPTDLVVDVGEASTLFMAAKHPKSFVSLDNADHLLSRGQDADYVALTLTAWAQRYLSSETAPAPQPKRPAVAAQEVLVTEQDAHFLRGLYTSTHQLQADEPLAKGGTNVGPNPYDLLLMSLGACTSMTLRMYANHKQLNISNLEVRLRYRKAGAEEGNAVGADIIERQIDYQGDLTDAQHQRLLAIANKCPVHKTLMGELQVRTRSERLDQ